MGQGLFYFQTKFSIYFKAYANASEGADDILLIFWSLQAVAVT